MIRFLTEDQQLRRALSEVLSEQPAADRAELTVIPVQGGEGISASVTEGVCTLRYETLPGLMRGAGLLAMGRTSFAETAAFHTLGWMVDLSENAVMTLDAAKRLCRLLAAQGYNAILLKTVKGSELSEAVTFEGLCGRFGADAMRALRSYAALFGIEVIPYIQYSELSATDSVAFERLIDGLLRLCAECFESRKIHFGFDRPALPGCGPYPAALGTGPVEEAGARLELLAALCLKYGLEARLGNEAFAALGETAEPPKGIVPVLSECTSVNRQSYVERLTELKEKGMPYGFAGGDNSWYGIVPLSWLSHTVDCNVLPALRQVGTEEVCVTAWRDDGGPCSFFATLPVLFAYGEACWGGNLDTEWLSARMLATVGVDFYDMVILEDIPAIRCRMNTGRIATNPGKYMFYDDLLAGDFFAHSSGAVKHLRKLTEWTAEKIERAGRYAYVYETLVAYCDVLAWKSDLQVRLYKAYAASDRDALIKVRDVYFSSLEGAIEDFRTKFRAQWKEECTEDGWSHFEYRIDLVRKRNRAAELRLREYLDGNVEKIEELEGTKPPYAHAEGLICDRDALLLNRWDMIEKGNRFS